MDKLNTIESRIDSMAGEMANMATKDDIANMATKDDIAELHSKIDFMASDFTRMETKLDATFEQVAMNTEFEATVRELAVCVEENTTDIKLLKKLVSNF